MRNLKAVIPFLLMPLAFACGHQVVEFGPDDAGNTVDSDAGATPDAGRDAGVPPDNDAGVHAAPTVISTVPLNAAMSVSVTTAVSATFSTAMAPTSITSTTFRLTQGLAVVSGMVTLDSISNTATFVPAAALGSALVYTATVTTGAKDVSGVSLAADHTWSFTTRAAVDVTPPSVVSTVPANAVSGVPINRSITATFSEAMASASINTGTFTLRTFDSAVLIDGTVTLDAAGNTTTFDPTSDLVRNTAYVATLSTGVQDLAGNAMVAEYHWSFTTASAADTAAPTVISTVPLDSATVVPVATLVSATFSEVMDSATITSATFTVREFLSGNAVTGGLNYAGVTAVFTPASPLLPGTRYASTISTGARDLAGNALLAPYVWTWTTAPAPDNTAPVVVSTLPADLATGVPANTLVTATFSETMDAATLTSPATTFTVHELISGNNVTGLVTYSGTTATFAPTANLTAGLRYTSTVTTAARDLAANPLAASHSWTWTIAAALDTTAPTVTSTIPLDLATGVAINSHMSAVFSEAMDGQTINSPAAAFVVKEFLSGNLVGGVVALNGATVTFSPTLPLLPSTRYSSTITTGAKDLAGNPLAADFVWTWTTAAALDILRPTVILTAPVDLATNVPVSVSVAATFSEPMDPATLTTLTFTVNESISNAAVTGTVSYDVQNRVATFHPQSPLAFDTGYTATVTNGAKDLAGNTLIVPAVGGLPKPNPWTFRTAAAVVVPPALAINLRGASSFGIASRAGLTSTGVTVVNGDVALYPLATCTDSTGAAGASQPCLVKTYSSPTGMTVNGSIYFAGDPFDNGGTAQAVTNDLTIAWTEGMNKVDTRGAVAADELGGQTFLPGVYHNSALGLAAGLTATLDAQNDANAIFIFKVDVSFVDSGTLLLPTRISLTNGAQARNVWFVTGSALTIGSGTTWNGNILAGGTATILDGSTVNGRVLAGAAGAGAITLTGAASPSVTTISVPQ